MSDGTAIEWTDATWNPIVGCSVVSPGCTNCYAMRLAGGRLRHHPSRAGLTVDSKAGPVWTGEVRLNEQWLDLPLRWKRPRRIFACAHGDLFHENVPDEWIDRVFAVMAVATWHTFQVLTKRPDRMRAWFAGNENTGDAVTRVATDAAKRMEDGDSWWTYLHQRGWPFPNVWLGVSAEDQRRADERLPDLRETPAAVRFVSFEPLLEPIITDLSGIDWAIVGGESGPGYRGCPEEAFYSLRDQCAAAGTAFFMKQTPGKRPIPADLMIREFPHG